MGKSFGQIRKYIPGVQIDSIILQETEPWPFILSNNDFYQYNLKDCIRSSHTVDHTPLPTFYLLDSVIYAFAPYNSGFLIGMGNGLHLFENGHIKKWNFPLDSPSGKISLISICGENFYFYQNQSIYFWNDEEYTLSRIALIPNLKSISSQCDNWGIIWASDGEILYQIGNPNERLPYLQMNRIKSGNKDVAIFNIKAYYPFPEKLSLEYRTTKEGSWISISPNNSIEIKSNHEIEQQIQSRATADGKYYTYSPIIAIERKDSVFNLWYLLFFPLLIIGVAYYILIKEKRYKVKLNEVKEKYKLSEELRIMQSQTSQLQMNPHFIFNSLNSINALISLNENKKAKIYLQKFSALMRSVLNFSEVKTIEVADEIRYLTIYLDLEKFSRNDSFGYKIINEVSDDAYIPPMLIQPFLENSIVHGFKGIDYPGFIDINFREKSGFIEIEIKDNGVGIKHTLKDVKEKHKSKALQITKSRLQNISKFRPGELKIEDLSDKDTSMTGTKVIIHIPI